LQAAIDAVPLGGQVIVYGGVYDEAVSLNKNVPVTCLEALTLDGLALSAGTFTAPPATLTLLGSFTRTGGVFDADSGALAFAAGGTSGYNLDLSIPTEFHDLSVASGVTLVEVQAADNASLSGTVTNNGVIRKTQSVSGTGPLSFGLTGVKMVITTQGSLSSLQVEWVGGSHPQAPPSLQNGRYEHITPTGSGYLVDLTLPHPMTPTASDLACRYLGALWDCAANSFNALQQTITRSGVSLLTTDWATGPLLYTFVPIVFKN
jgi:hypothetical protein